MTDIAQKALALINEILKERRIGGDCDTIYRATDATDEALCRAIEQHEAFRQEVSEFALGVREYMACCNVLGWQGECDNFIITKPDPLAEAMLEIGVIPNAPALRAALEARGLTITTVEKD